MECPPSYIFMLEVTWQYPLWLPPQCRKSLHHESKQKLVNICLTALGDKVIACLLSCSAILWPVSRQAPLSMGFSRQKYWSGLPCPSQTGWLILLKPSHFITGWLCCLKVHINTKRKSAIPENFIPVTGLPLEWHGIKGPGGKDGQEGTVSEVGSACIHCYTLNGEPWRTHSTAKGTLLHVVWQPGWGAAFGGEWIQVSVWPVPSPFTWNSHHIVNGLYSNIK